jgi:hypothetical protein
VVGEANVTLNVTAGSTSQRKKFGELLRWFHDSKSLAGTVVEAA